MNYVKLLNHHAQVLQFLGNQEEARKVCEASLKICEDNYQESPEILKDYISCLNRFSWVLNDQNRFQEALEKSRKSCKLSVQTFGENHPTSLDSLTSLGQILVNSKKLK